MQKKVKKVTTTCRREATKSSTNDTHTLSKLKLLFEPCGVKLRERKSNVFAAAHGRRKKERTRALDFAF